MGRTQKITIGVFASPFIAATAALFLGNMDAPTWTGFMQFLVPSVLGPLLLGGAYLKTKAAATTKADE